MYNFFEYLKEYPLPVIGTLLIPLPVFFILYNRAYKEKCVLIFLVYLLVKLNLDIEATYLAFKHQNNLFIHNTIILIELVFVLLFYSYNLLLVKYNKWFLLIGVLFSIFFFWDVYQSNEEIINTRNIRWIEYGSTVSGVLIIGVILLFLYEIIKHPIIIDLYIDSGFYISVYLLLFHCSKIFFSPLLYYVCRWGTSPEWFEYIPDVFEIYGMLFLSIYFYNYDRKN